MFYSQFILAKKGPLGTIWIAAHLERKLRKNQVADTDIGVSVDSILFPEAPIALRLSSHLLLGVVRIYSRKVNYLFHDCSEALLKIKQAFRSTAVDLPPEESTAPYHSITLPETFHLDDFELPDSAFLHGNSVDHHVSTREQITLQDNIDGLGYLTSQFGSDERFGDGDTSQFGLDLDEDVFLDKVTSSQHASVSFDTEYAVSHDQPIATFNDMDIGQSQYMDGDMDAKMSLDTGDIEINENPSGDHGYNIQTPDLNEVLFRKDQIEGQSPTSGHISSAFPVDDIPSPQLIECAQTPSTPILLEGSMSAHAQEIPPLIPPEKNSVSSFVDATERETEGILHPECDCPGATNNNLDALAISPESTDLVMPIPTSTAVESISLEPQRVTAAGNDHNFGGEQSVDGLQNKLMPSKTDGLPMPDEIDDNIEVALCDNCSPGAKNLMNHLDASLHNPNTLNDANDRDPISAVLQPCSSKLGKPNIVSVEGRTFSEDILSLSCKDMHYTSETPPREGVVHPSGSSVDVPGEDSCLADVLEPMVRVHQTSDSVLSENTTSAKKQKELTPIVSAKDNQLDQLNCTSSSEFPEPEKLLSAPNGNTDLPNDLGQLTSEKGVTESDESVDRNKSLSGKKHHLTDSMSALQSGSSAKSAGRPRLRRNREHIPDDDDLLASILVGRTPNFKSQPTPSHKINSVKRPRLNPKVSLLKRKVLFDDTMVLHADAIRQQLINSEDIRRIRKKAPCTRSEIWMVLSSSEELEFFEEPIFTGISAELHSLHARTYTSSGNPAFPSSSKYVGKTCNENVGEQVVVLADNVDGEIQVPSNLSVLTEPSSCKDAGDCDAQERVVSQPDLPQQEPLDNNTHNSTQEIDGRITADAHVVSSNFVGGVKVLTDSCIEVSCIHENHKSDASYVKSDDACMPTREQPVHESNELKEMNDEATVLSKNGPSNNFTSMEDADSANGADRLDNGATPHPIDSSSHDKDETCLQVDPCVLPGDENLSVPDVMMEFVEPNSATINGQQDVEQDKEDFLDVGPGDNAFQEQLFFNEEHPSALGVHEEMTEKASSSPFHTVDETENFPSTVGENSGFRVLNIEGVMDDESTPMDFSTVIESSDFCSAINGNTEFLNADDEEDHCEADNDLQNPEEAQSLENSGWSSRTRGVARYLKSLFDDEYGHGRKVVAMDHLIAGKTRKEASRMFFETLVLKTKDYIQVEQANPFDIINIKPQTKLLKSEF
ncbi:sister chromatid cohesion 1 protein 4-like isoform X2 [Dioscorea cayenensis subsp. rotundata]|uniref:Sister chromatid cohesion 1 protein 4-like isoform X2 n=1 Tax=Dioscorea cayennensis subsp. rotundata TaxID=55577 RepID=A0AB40B123_DIOCR|nr:sister chromatid cohesion 1 protein 4-like isoform X2 [Dioscorea cayenensis subsp. rotundata]